MSHNTGRIKQHIALAKQQKIWAMQAHRDAIYNLKRAKQLRKQHKFVQARGMMQEYTVDEYWAERRRGIAREHERLAGKR